MKFRSLLSILTGLVLMASASSSMAVSLFFNEFDNLGGIVIEAVNQDGVLTSSGLIPGEFARAGNRDGCARSGGCNLSINRAGLGNQPTGTAIVMLEADGVTISDMIVMTGVPGFIVWDFFSDPSQFPTNINVVASVIETGNIQLVYTYINDQGQPVSMFARSGLDVPEPASLALLGIGLAGLGFGRRKKA